MDKLFKKSIKLQSQKIEVFLYITTIKEGTLVTKNAILKKKNISKCKLLLNDMKSQGDFTIKCTNLKWLVCKLIVSIRNLWNVSRFACKKNMHNHFCSNFDLTTQGASIWCRASCCATKIVALCFPMRCCSIECSHVDFVWKEKEFYFWQLVFLKDW